jgi:asparagine synthase (glutamine-hydrolysing)
MCGINGILSAQIITDVNKRIDEMNQSIGHRGPDAEGKAIISDKIAFGHRRLSIIDLDQRANQPMYSNSRKSVIVFNGEIFNYKDIKNDLLSLYDFKTNSDTEVILASFEIKGIGWFLKRANGMFAFALYNQDQDELILVRDRFGIKPLFYAISDKTLVFSSEVKGILNSGLISAKFNNSAVDEYLGNRYVREPYTFFENIYQVNSASYLLFKNDLTYKEKSYWKLPLMNFDNNYDEKLIINTTIDKIEEAIKRWLIADVKVGAYLSGGVDSSLTTAVLSKYSNVGVDTYTIGFDDEGFNEFKYAQIVSKIYKTKHREFLLDSVDYFSELEKLIYFKDAPLGVPNEIPLAIMSTNLSKDITVVISGEGADELFGGYGKIFRSAFDFNNHFANKGLTFYEYFMNKYEYVPRAVRDKYLYQTINYRDFYDSRIIEDFSKYTNEENIFRFFHMYHIKGLLNRVDMTTMQTAVEARPPFLDHELIEYVYQNVPYNLKLKWNSKDSENQAKKLVASDYSEVLDTPKYILKKVSEVYLPDEIIYRKKIGFPVPLTNWFPELASLSKKSLKDAEWLKPNVINDLCSELKTSERAGQLLWMFLNIELFKKKYFNKNWCW